MNFGGDESPCNIEFRPSRWYVVMPYHDMMTSANMHAMSVITMNSDRE